MDTNPPLINPARPGQQLLVDLWNSIRRRNGDQCRVLLEHQSSNANILFNTSNSSGNTLLHLAVGIQNPEIVQHVIETNGMNVNARNNNTDTPLHLAVINAHPIRRALFEWNRDNIATEESFLNIINHLIKGGTHVNTRGGERTIGIMPRLFNSIGPLVARDSFREIRDIKRANPFASCSNL